MKQFSIVSQSPHALESPEHTMVWKPTVQVGDEQFVADVVVHLKGPSYWPHLAVVEFHDCPYPTPGSGRRARLLKEAHVPVVRLYPDDLKGDDTPTVLRRKVREACRPAVSVN